jgi:hypothetical protein
MLSQVSVWFGFGSVESNDASNAKDHSTTYSRLHKSQKHSAYNLESHKQNSHLLLPKSQLKTHLHSGIFHGIYNGIFQRVNGPLVYVYVCSCSIRE